MFLGIAIGDALGVPAETKTAEEIRNGIGRITNYMSAKEHKWYKDLPIGAWTDDTQLSLAIAESLSACGKVNMVDIAKKHVTAAVKYSTRGWGDATKSAVQKLRDKVHYSESGTEGSAGNGVVMKIAPLAAYFFSRRGSGQDWSLTKDEAKVITDLAFMTHLSQLAVASAFAQVYAVMYCLEKSHKEFVIGEFLDRACEGARLGESLRMDTNKDKLSKRIIQLKKMFAKDGIPTDEEMVKAFGGGTCYVYNSLPFTYAFFLRDPNSIEALYDVINAGGDTDSNGSMVGSLLGALNGDIFPYRLKEGLCERELVEGTAKKFCKKFVKGDGKNGKA
jgi:ADP-ribosylglycohydrolase